MIPTYICSWLVGWLVFDQWVTPLPLYVNPPTNQHHCCRFQIFVDHACLASCASHWIARVYRRLVGWLIFNKGDGRTTLWLYAETGAALPMEFDHAPRRWLGHGGGRLDMGPR